MIDHIDGSVQKPSQYLVDSAGVLTTGVNPSFLSWKKRDKALLTLIYSTLSPPVLSMVVGLHSAQEVWSTLETRFTSTARANVLNLKLELQSVKKGSDSISAYMQRVKTARDKLSAVGVQIDDEEMLHMVLKGLPKDYSSFNSAIRTRDDSLTFEKLSVLLQTEELSINESSELNSSLAICLSPIQIGRPMAALTTIEAEEEITILEEAEAMADLVILSSSSKPVHSLRIILQAHKVRTNPIWLSWMDFAYQGKNPPTKLAAMANASNLNMTQGTGPEQVSVGNGQNLPIQNIGKMHKLPFSISVPKSEFPLHVLHADLWGPAPIQSYNGFRYYLVIVDDYTKFCWVYLLKNKSDTFTTFQQFKVMAEKHYNSSIHFLRTDCGGEFTSTAFNSYCANSGIIHHLTCPHTPQQNGVAERKHRHLIQITLALLSQSGLSLSYWSYAIATACHLINKLPTPLLNMSFSLGTAAPLTPIPVPNSAETPTHVPFSAVPPIPVPNFAETSIPAPNFAVPPVLLPHSAEPPNSAVTPSSAPTSAAPAQPSPLPAPVQNTHPMLTRSKLGIFKPKTCYKAQLDYTLIEPPSFKLAQPISQWCQAMQDEYDALIRQGTWSLVPPPQHHNIVGCKWVYKLKTHSDGSIARYKARLVAKGFHQQQGIDFDETFSPVIKPPTVRMILSLAVSLNWPLRQLDVSNAFLHGILKEEAPRAWFERFTGQLLQFGFTASAADSSLFIYRSKTIIAYLLLYVDDIVLTSNTPTFLDTLIHHLSSIFELKDLGPLHYFLGIQVTRDSKGLHLSQAKYATTLLHKHNMTSTKPVSTPCTPNTRLSLHDGEKLQDPHAYRSLVGALHYLTFTRPDLSFAVHQDADWAGDPDDRRSTSGLLVYLGPNPITWSAKKQLTDLGVFISEAPILWCDNISALAIASNPVFHARTKHIEVDFHFVRERVLRKDLAVKFVSTHDQLADIFTKSLPPHRFLDLRRNLMAFVRPPELEEGC
uniref:Integrase catalytic domain-containing protein n=1 Tax=Fagus sylvatica TaxID=28930 RepID=A0A2N9J670_FAGSY